MNATGTRSGIGIVLVFTGIALDVVGNFVFPTGSTQCQNGICTTTATPPTYYGVEIVGTGIFVLGVVLVYLATRPRFKTMFP